MMGKPERKKEAEWFSKGKTNDAHVMSTVITSDILKPESNVSSRGNNIQIRSFYSDHR